MAQTGRTMLDSVIRRKYKASTVEQLIIDSGKPAEEETQAA